MDAPILKTIGKLILPWTAALCIPLYAASSKIETTVRPARISLGGTAVLTVSIEGAGSGVKCDRLPNIPGLGISFSGIQQRFSFVNGRFSKEAVLSYTLYPQKEGTFTIPALTFTDGRESYASQAVSLSVSAGHSQGSSAGVPSLENASGSTVFIGKCSLSREEAFVGEPVFLSYYLYSRGSGTITLAGFEKLPNTVGFVSKEFEENQPDEIIESGEGNIYKEHICTFVLLPAESGNKQAGECSAVFSVAERSIFNFPRRRQILFEPVNIKIKPLPEKDKPADFSGNVGSFAMRLSDYDKAAEVFDEKKLTVTIEGSGNLIALGKPIFVPGDSGVRTFIGEGKADFLREEDTLKGKADFDITLIPEKAGVLNAGKLRFTFYDTQAGTYKALESLPIELNVTGAADEEESFSFDDKEQGTEIKYVPAALLIAGLLIIAVLAVFIIRRRSNRAALAAQANVKPEPDPEAPNIPELYKKSLYAAKLNDEASFAEAIDRLFSALGREEKRDVSKELAAIGQIKDELYALRFGGGQISANKMADWEKRLRDSAGRN